MFLIDTAETCIPPYVSAMSIRGGDAEEQIGVSVHMFLNIEPIISGLPM